MSHAVLARASKSAPVAKGKASSPSAADGLRIGEPNDAFEQEADRVADRVMNGPQGGLEWSLSQIHVSVPLQRKCSCGSGNSSGECEECRSRKTVQRKAADPIRSTVAPPIVHEVLRSPGQPLDENTCKQFEPLFGHEFSRVRLHTDSRAAESARAINALAYTSGNDIVFGENQFSPTTKPGQRLLAHELTHTIQQQQSQPTHLQRAPSPKATANWWNDKSIGVKPEAKFWDDLRLFFPKDARKFSGSKLDNIPNIECDNRGMVSIGKGYWDESDPMKRKASIAALITKVDKIRYNEARIDDEDLTNDGLVTQLKALKGSALQKYVQQLKTRSTYINNSQVIAFLTGNDRTKNQIAASQRDKLLEWKFTTNRLTDADFRDDKINTRL